MYQFDIAAGSKAELYRDLLIALDALTAELRAEHAATLAQRLADADAEHRAAVEALQAGHAEELMAHNAAHVAQLDELRTQPVPAGDARARSP